MVSLPSPLRQKWVFPFKIHVISWIPAYPATCCTSSFGPPPPSSTFMWMITWMAVVNSRDRPREGARGAQRTYRGGPEGAYRGDPASNQENRGFSGFRPICVLVLVPYMHPRAPSRGLGRWSWAGKLMLIRIRFCLYTGLVVFTPPEVANTGPGF